MDFSIAKKAINYFVDQAPSDILSICFFGSEPLLNFNLMNLVRNFQQYKVKCAVSDDSDI